MTDSDSLRERFDEIAGEYDEFAGNVPVYYDLQEEITDVFTVWFEGWKPSAVLEFGPGEGRRMEWIVDRVEPERYDLVDFSEEMLNLCGQKLSNRDHQPESRIYRSSFEAWKPEREYDLIHSSLSVHHMESSQRRDLFRRWSSALRREGRLLLADVVRAVPEWGSFHYRMARMKNLRTGSITGADFEERWRGHLLHDRPTRWDRQRKELRNAGLRDVDLVCKLHNYVIYVARGPVVRV